MQEDYASLMEWFYENDETFIRPFIEQHFKEVSWTYEYSFMQEHIIYTKAIIEDYKLTQEEKIQELLDNVYRGKSKMVMVVGARGSGKTGFALWLADEARNNAGHKRIYYVGEPESKEIYPKYFAFVKGIDDLPNNCMAVVDEAAIKYSSRDFQKQDNKDLTSMMVIARHKNITLIIITQNVSLIDINIDRLADIMIYKMASNYGIRKKRGEVLTKEQRERNIIMKRMKPRTKEECLIEYMGGPMSIFRKFYNPLPWFWDDNKISKSFAKFRNNNKKEESEQQKTAVALPYNI